MDELSGRIRTGLEDNETYLGSPSVHDAIRRGRQKRRMRLLAVVTSSSLLVGAGAFAIFSLLDSSSGDQNRIAPAAQPAEKTTSLQDAAAAFAVRAIAEAGLLHSEGTFYDYEGIVGTEDGWEVTFVAYECKRTAEEASCSKNPDQSTAILKVIEDGDQFRIADSSGPAKSEERQELNNYSESSAPKEPEMQLLGLQILDQPGGDGKVVEIRGTILWTGPIATDAMLSVTCTVEALDESGNVVYSESVQDVSVSGEAGRSGSVFGLAIPADGSPVVARGSC